MIMMNNGSVSDNSQQFIYKQLNAVDAQSQRNSDITCLVESFSESVHQILEQFL